MPRSYNGGQNLYPISAVVQGKGFSNGRISYLRVFSALPLLWCLAARHIVERAPILEQGVLNRWLTKCGPRSKHTSGRAPRKEGKEKQNRRKENRQEKRKKNTKGGGRKKEGKKKKGGGAEDAKAQSTQGRRTRNARDKGGTQEKKNAGTTPSRATPARRGPSRQLEHQQRPQEKVRRTKTRLGGRPARPGQGSRHTHTRTGPGPGVLRPERGGVGVHTKQPRCTGRVPCRKTDGMGNRTRQ